MTDPLSFAQFCADIAGLIAVGGTLYGGYRGVKHLKNLKSFSPPEQETTVPDPEPMFHQPDVAPGVVVVKAESMGNGLFQVEYGKIDEHGNILPRPRHRCSVAIPVEVFVSSKAFALEDYLLRLPYAHF